MPQARACQTIPEGLLNTLQLIEVVKRPLPPCLHFLAKLFHVYPFTHCQMVEKIAQGFPHQLACAAIHACFNLLVNKPFQLLR